jgi:putative endonuclease
MPDTRGARARNRGSPGFFVFKYMIYYLYILKSIASGKDYTGISENPERRLEYHNSIGKGFTARYRPWEIVFSKKYSTKIKALEIERKIKSCKSRKMIEKIILGEIKI